ncbi:MAG: hypothetical protein JWM81_450 [Candidatus Saccharibacteria bacterium]|nr:hypothetical protein [Candidatus Saccharibacteria bacterium]
MNPKKVYLLMIAAILALVIAIGGGAYGVRNLLQAKSTELVQLKAKLVSYNDQQVALQRAKKDITQYTELYNISKVVVPENKNQAETVRQIVKLAGDNSVTLGSITFPSSTLGTLPGAAGAAAAAGTTSLTQKAPKSSTGAASLSQLTPVVGSPGVYVLQITVTGSTQQPATYPQLISFLSALERNRLTAEVTNINILPSASSTSKFSFTLSLNSYIKP